MVYVIYSKGRKNRYATLEAAKAVAQKIYEATGTFVGIEAEAPPATIGRHGYNPVAVDAAIASSNRHGRRIGGREAKLIHALLRGRG